MKNLFKYIVCLILLFGLSVTYLNAQLGFKAGYVNSVVKNKNNGHKDNHQYRGFEVGVIYDMELVSYLALQYSILYNMNFSSERNGTLRTNSTAHYVDVPIRLTYSYHFNQNWSVFAYAGPSLVIGIAGESVYKGRRAGVSKSNWYGDKNVEDFNMRRFDLQVGGGVGVRYRNIILKGGYDWGSFNMSQKDNTTIRRNQFDISLSYLL